MGKLWSAYLLIFSLLAISCSEKTLSEPEATFFDIQSENGFVGTVNRTNAFVALLIGENEGIAYVCNGDEGISEWFKGTVNEPTEFSFTNSNGAHISAQFTGTSFEGEVSLRNDITFSFSADPSNSEDAGIYRVMGDEAALNEVEAGWILDSEGSQRGALKISSVFKTSLGTISDGTSNIVISGKSYPVFRFLIPSPPAPGAPIPYPNTGKSKKK